MSDIANAAAVSSGTPISAPARSATLRWLLLVSVLAIVACVPYLPMLYSVGDEGVLLHGAARMLSGRVVYNDFFEFLPPGGLVLTEAWFSVFGVTFASARLLALLTVMGTGFFTFLACRQASGNALLALVFTAVWLFVSQGVVDTQVSHHAFTTALSMFVAWASCVTATAAKPEVSRSVMAGFAAGAATMITPTRGLLTALAGLTPFLNLRTHIWPLAGYVAAGAIAPLCTLGYLVSQHALLAAFDDIIRFTATRYAGIQGVPFGYGSQGAGLLLLFLFPFAAVLILLVVIRDRQSLRNPLLRPCLGFAIAGFVGCFPRCDIDHVAYAAPLALPLLGYSFQRLAQEGSLIIRSAAAAIGVVVAASAAFDFAKDFEKVLHAEIVSTPRGPVAFRPGVSFSKLLARVADTPATDKFFFYPYMPMAPFLSAREHVANYDIYTPGYTTPSQYRDACISVVREATWVVIDRWWQDPKNLRRGFPAIKNPEPLELKGFEQALRNGFEVVAQEGLLELRRRRPDASDTLCGSLNAD